MRKSTVYINYRRWDDDSLSTLAGHIVTALTANSFFSEPRPTLEVFGELVADFQEKNQAARRDGSRQQREARDNARLRVEIAMKELAFYVNLVAQGDREMLASSGFVLVPEQKGATVPGAPTNLRVVDGRRSGEIGILFNAVKEASEYEYQVSSLTDAQSNPIWDVVLRTSRSRTNYIADLVPASRCYVRVRARNRVGDSSWTEAVSFIVR